MSSIVTCSCGAKVRLPAGAANRSFRCPQCKSGIALTVDARVLVSSQLTAGQTGATCPICQSPIAAEEMAVTCPKCDQIHHQECWAEIGGCGTYGCEQAPAVEKGATAAQPPLSAWGDTKKCPVCGETIKAITLRCRFCGTDFDTVDPLSLQDVRRKIITSEAAKGLRSTVIALFIISIAVGCLAPLMAVINLCVFLPKRREIAKQGPVYVVLAYSALAISLIYSVLMLLFGLVHGVGS